MMDLRKDDQLKFSEPELIKIDYEIIEGVAFLNTQENIEVGFSTPSDIHWDIQNS